MINMSHNRLNSIILTNPSDCLEQLKFILINYTLIEDEVFRTVLNG